MTVSAAAGGAWTRTPNTAHSMGSAHQRRTAAALRLLPGVCGSLMGNQVNVLRVQVDEIDREDSLFVTQAPAPDIGDRGGLRSILATDQPAREVRAPSVFGDARGAFDPEPIRADQALDRSRGHLKRTTKLGHRAGPPGVASS